ncbi:MAG: NAD(P)H-dependent glycerol-3-phosphate dehydrogenase [Myxococcota bacterium]
MKIGVIGGGSWGTAISKLLGEKQGYKVTLWAYEKNVCDEINSEHINNTFLPGFSLPESVAATNDIAKAVKGQEVIILVTPSHVIRKVLNDCKSSLDAEIPIVCCAKGIENDSLMLMSEVMEDVLPERFHPYLAVLSGPSFAREVAQGQPTVVTVAAYMEKISARVQQIFSTERFRAYRSTDITGVEIGGAVKNVIAIATGCVAGLGFGENTRAAVITRGLAEITRLAVKKGANPYTLMGPSGLGDLVLTCSGALSRNRTVGLRLGKGESLKDILQSMVMVAEGVNNARSVRDLAQKLEVEMPIANETYEILYNDKSPKEAVQSLMTRPLKHELSGY